jgi:hypothetical protein
MLFWTGTHEVSWLARTSVPLFISRRRLTKLKRLPKAIGPWALDSGGFSELSMYGKWRTWAEEYVYEVRRWSSYIGNMQWAAIQDWMCEPFITAKTGLTVKQHQQRTVDSYLELTSLAPEQPWVPVLQGWSYLDYMNCVRLYKANGVDLTSLPLVGLGSVCRRQHTTMVERLIRNLTDSGIKLHGFGFKLQGLKRVAKYLTSADSMAWSFGARRTPIRMKGCPHRNCANCMRYALHWRESVLKVIDRCEGV